jgi:predicted SAM-dependent methyltransferase
MLKKYILGSGLHWPAAPDVVRVDILPAESAVDLVMDLNQYPWREIPTGAALHINASHILEHLVDVPKFMDECWRILVPGGSMYIEVPEARNIDLAWSDPTHKRPFTVHSFINYFTLEGVRKFTYTYHAWVILYLHTDGNVIRLHASPLPDEFLYDETFKPWGG